ncbi:(3R)-hydroxymyristoyl-[acyl-carrier-protein] dehydratase [Sutterella wadsworthensis CAG:135]|nr:(3R)-hydroxymyristoyl-[acyl-carrier-protein] dehydratase [Sutterella wadsworthensis CAG:135]
MPKSLNIQDIMEMLPHRFPFLLIDRVVADRPGG